MSGDEGRGQTLRERHAAVRRATDWLNSDDAAFDAEAVAVVQDLLRHLRDAPLPASDDASGPTP